MLGSYRRPRSAAAPSRSEPRGLLANSVAGSPGKERWELLQVLQVFTMMLIIPMITLAIGYPAAALIPPILILISVCFQLYNLLVPGPWRCFDVSPPLRFELTLDSITVTRWEPGRCWWHLHEASQNWGAAEVEAVNVYMQTEMFRASSPIWPCKRRAADEVEKQSPVQLIQSGSEAYEKVPAWFSPCQLLCGTQQHFNCFFLGLQLRGAAEVIPISRHVWTHEGLQELLDLCNKVRLFQQGELSAEEPEGPRSKKAPKGSVSTVTIQTWRYSTTWGNSEDAIADEAPEVDECAICLENFRDGDLVNLLPCGHVFHCACARRWLQIGKHCPMCKQKVSCDSLAVPPTGIRPCVATSVELRPLDAAATSTEPKQPHRPCTLTCV